MTKRDTAETVDTAELSEFIESAPMAFEAGQPSRTWPLPSDVRLSGPADDRVIVATFNGAIRSAGPNEMKRLLWSFAYLSLVSASDERILRFAKRAPLAIDADGIIVAGVASSHPTRVFWYREYAALVAATLRTATRAQHSQGIHNDDSPVFERFVRRGMQAGRASGATHETKLACREFLHLILNRPQGVEEAREAVSAVINWWLVVGRVRPAIWWKGEVAQQGWSGEAWGAIGAQLATTVMRQLGEPRCGYCDRVLEGRPRRPKANQVPCCGRDECQRKAAAARQRASRERKRARRK